MKPFRLTASKLKRYLQCPRAYFLRYVQGADETPGGKYLEIGTAYDLHVQWYLSRGARGVQSIDPRIVRMFDAARRCLPEPGSVEVQHRYSIPHPDGFVVEGTPDLRRPGWLGDTKTTSASEAGVGSAMNEAQLEADIQFRLYSWCEYQLDASLVKVDGVWSYVNKDTKPKAWNVGALVWCSDVEEWFDAVVRPAAAAMAQLDAEADADRVLANLDSCDRCWVRAACDPFAGVNTYDGQLDHVISPASLKRTRPVSPAGGVQGMAFDLKKLTEDVDLTPALQESLAEFHWVKAQSVADDIPINPPNLAAIEALAQVVRSVHIPINPPPHPLDDKGMRLASDHTATFEALAQAVADCTSAAERAGRLLAQLRGGGGL